MIALTSLLGSVTKLIDREIATPQCVKLELDNCGGRSGSC